MSTADLPGTGFRGERCQAVERSRVVIPRGSGADRRTTDTPDRPRTPQRALDEDRPRLDVQSEPARPGFVGYAGCRAEDPQSRDRIHRRLGRRRVVVCGIDIERASVETFKREKAVLDLDQQRVVYLGPRPQAHPPRAFQSSTLK
jgi:hypothetical protein